MKYFKLHSLVDKFKVLVLKEFDDEYYVSSSNKNLRKITYKIKSMMVAGTILQRSLKKNSMKMLKD